MQFHMRALKSSATLLTDGRGQTVVAFWFSG